MNDNLFIENQIDGDCDVLDQLADDFDLFDDLPFDQDDEPSDEALALIEAELVG